MGDRHLTDDEIQEYLDIQHSELADRVEKHTASCDICKSMLQNYTSLYSGLDDETGFDLPFDFTKNVIKATDFSKSDSFQSRFSNQILAISGLVAASVAFTLLSDVSILSNFVLKIGTLLGNTLSKPFGGDIGSASGTFGLILPGVFAVFTIWILDRHVLHAKKKPSSLMI